MTDPKRQAEVDAAELRKLGRMTPRNRRRYIARRRNKPARTLPPPPPPRVEDPDFVPRPVIAAHPDTKATVTIEHPRSWTAGVYQRHGWVVVDADRVRERMRTADVDEYTATMLAARGKDIIE